VGYKKNGLLLLILTLAFWIPAASAADQPVELKQVGNRIDVLIGGRPFTTYYFGPQAPKPYLHPLRSARGTIVTRGFPMVKNIPGESHDHPHHRALYFAHGDINGIDFWGEAAFAEKGPVVVKGKRYSSEELPKGRTVFRKLEEMRSGPDSGIVRASFDLIGPDGKAIGGETQAYTFRGDESERMIDCEFTLLADHGGPLKMGDTKEGTFAIRVVKALEEPQVHMLNSRGGAAEKGIWGKQADWVDYSGTVAGEKLGIAIFDHPASVKHPTYWHARGYGLFAVNPFGEHDYYNDPKRDGSVTIPAGGSLLFRYRVLIHPGDAAEAEVAEAYQRYTEEK
jgi:methane monooxygenase PmoA-like